eukprot:TRINITY_DN6679_c4_g1_i1.p1 TRINITY_DN6679_c4_g1~~TRINITY_DN6679_c4_g1_i1.p1  ORF type:complete len:511 (+),score=64.16 TRINITY_DN6679_c4_g1_i1:51-1535(+)
MPTMPVRRGSSGGYHAGGNEMIAGRYQVISEAGRGNFARVVKAKDTQTGEIVAVKILGPEYARDAKFELEVLEGITKRDPKNHFKVCKLLQHFKTSDGSNCFVFNLLGQSLKQRKTGIRDSTTKKNFKNLVKQLGRALQYLHFECKLIHTDLKPENILLDSPNDVKGMGSAWTIVDLGSASFYSERPDGDLISTRPYRAPEVLVGGTWSYGADMWSFGCILYELYTGRTLFDVASDAQHLQLIERKIGRAPSWLADHASQNVKYQLFDSSNRLRHAIGAGPPQSFTDEFRDDPLFADLLRRLLHYDPVLRMRADEVVNHPYVSSAESVKGQTGVLTKIPSSAYSSGRIRCPGAMNMNAPRARLDAGLPQENDRSRSGSGEERAVARRASGEDRYRRGSGGEAYRPAPEARRGSGDIGYGGSAQDIAGLERQLARLGMPSRHMAPPPPQPSRAIFAAEDSFRAISAADAALYPRHGHGHGPSAYAPLPLHHQRRY